MNDDSWITNHTEKKLQFEEALNTPDPKEGLQRLIDPALGEDYPMDSIFKVRPNPQTEQYNAAAEIRLPSLLCVSRNMWG